MSAIWGVISKNGQPVKAETIARIKHAMAHRATDGSEEWSNGRAALGFCKLMVYARQATEHLPLEADDLVITADVRLDNRDELYKLLGLDVQQVQTLPDAYLLLQSYLKWGEKCIDHLDGEFAFAIWNKHTQSLFAATDAMGYRPMFYYNGSEEFIFCSEIKGITAIKNTANYFNDEHLIDSYFLQSPAELTYNRDIFLLTGGHTLTFDDKVAIKKYWTLDNSKEYNYSKAEDWIEAFRHLLYKAVEKRLSTDSPVGISLSGGLDSSTVACILSEILAKKNQPLYAFSSVLPENYQGIEQDERKYIEIINRYCPNIIQTYVVAPDVGPLSNVSGAFDLYESIPNAFFYMDVALMQEVQAKNIRSHFGGFGGDYWVSWRCKALIYRLWNGGKKQLAWQLLSLFSKTEGLDLFNALKLEVLQYSPLYNSIKERIKGKPDTWHALRMMQEGFANQYPYVNRPDKSGQERYNHKHFMMSFINKGRIGKLAGMLQNVYGSYNMASFEPLLDKDLLEFLSCAPPELFLYKGHKRGLLRHAMDGILPPEIQWRNDKIAFNPDSDRRVIECAPQFNAMLDAEEYQFIFNKYYAKNNWIEQFSNIKPQHAIMTAKLHANGVRAAQAGIAAESLLYLKNRGYKFL